MTDVRGRATGRGPAAPARPAPGVSVQWTGPLFRQLTGRRGDIAGFAGCAVRGPVGSALRLTGPAEFDAAYGPASAGSYLSAAVHGFFGNGGQVCWVQRAAHRAQAAEQVTATPPFLTFTATSPGTWANGLVIDLLPTGGERFALTLTAPDGRREIWRDLAVATLAERFDPGAGSTSTMSALVTAVAMPGTAVPVTPSRTVLTGGDDGLSGLTAAELADAALFPDIPEIGLVAVPDLLLRQSLTDPLPSYGPDEIAAAQGRLVSGCEELHDRTALLHHPDSGALADDVIAWRDRFSSAYAAVYWPWLAIVDPDRPGETRAVPPAGHVAGVIARTELAGGPQQPPANQIVTGVVGVTVPVDDERHGQVNEGGVNAVRATAGRGIRLLGARTASADPQWRYLNVRRLLDHIELGIAAEAAWLVFEPNGPQLRDSLDRVIRQFLDDLWRAGGLDGATADEAYSVAVDDTDTAGDGRLIAEIGVLPPWPAEFVVVRIDVSERGADHGRDG